ncbi:MAG: FAD-dependent oxidoreductase [Chitinophagia bacterium]|jgi:hypothetical protein
MRTLDHQYEFVVVGGGLAGICAAVTASRKNIKTALIQDRPVLGGNASTEIRVPPVGATQCNFAYSRETGLIEELFLNNLYRNPTCSPEGWNLELESLVRNEPNLDLFLNCAVCNVETAASESSSTASHDVNINSIKAYCSMAETWYIFHAPYYADCSGDGILGAEAGAAFRYGVEARSEFNEPLCPDEPAKETMGMSLQLRARDAGRPIPFLKPDWVQLELNAEDFGPYRPVSEQFFPDTGGFWWLEWGGELDTVHDTLKIKEEVQRITLAVWDYLKNRSPISEKLRTYELDWMGAVPGKRESRRFEGDHILTMGDIDMQLHFDDAVAYGGWGFDHHPPGGFHDKVNPSTHQYLRGPHNVPLRSLYSRNIANLFFAGRNISASHYALSSTRVMLTCAQLGEAVGMAAAHAVQLGGQIRKLTQNDHVRDIQFDLQKNDHHISHYPIFIPRDFAPSATVSASSVFAINEKNDTWGKEQLTGPRMQMLTIITQQLESIQIKLDATSSTQLKYKLAQGPSNSSTYPDKGIASGYIELLEGNDQWVTIPVSCTIDHPGWYFLMFEENSNIWLHVSETPPGQLRYYPRPEDPIRPNPFSKWTLRSLAIGQNKAADADGAKVMAPDWNEHALRFKEMSCFLGFSYMSRIFPTQPIYDPSMVVNEHSRPTNKPNLWVSSVTEFDRPEWIELSWDSSLDIDAIQILFDSSLHFHFGQSWQGYQTNAIPSLVKAYRVISTFSDGTEKCLVDIDNNCQRNRIHKLAVENVKKIKIECLGTQGINRAHIYSLRVFGTENGAVSKEL